ncbi:MAG: flagellar export protein FliJ [Mediterraneibacter faecis]
MARRKKLENTSLEEQLEYVEQEICTKESDLKELRHKAKEIQKEIEEKQKDELFKALVASGKTIDEVMRFIKATGEDKIDDVRI